MSSDTGPVREAVVARLRSHGRAMFWPSVLLVAVAVAVGYFGGSFPEAWQNLAVIGGGALLAIVGFVLPLCSWLARNYTITTRRIVLRHGVFVRTRQELLHSRGYDVTVRKNSVQSMFGSGDVVVHASAERPIVLRDVPSADLVQSALGDLMEGAQSRLARRQRDEER